MTTKKATNEATDVASFTDAWIETVLMPVTRLMDASHLLQMRGLKQSYYKTTDIIVSRIFYRCVD